MICANTTIWLEETIEIVEARVVIKGVAFEPVRIVLWIQESLLAAVHLVAQSEQGLRVLRLVDGTGV